MRTLFCYNYYPHKFFEGSLGRGRFRKLSVICLHNNAIVAHGILVTILHCGTPEHGLSAIYIVSSVGTSFHYYSRPVLIFLFFQNLSRPVLICELLRSCMMGLIDSTGGADELKWAAFTFLKVRMKHMNCND